MLSEQELKNKQAKLENEHIVIVNEVSERDDWYDPGYKDLITKANEIYSQIQLLKWILGGNSTPVSPELKLASIKLDTFILVVLLFFISTTFVIQAYYAMAIFCIALISLILAYIASVKHHHYMMLGNKYHDKTLVYAKLNNSLVYLPAYLTILGIVIYLL